MDSFCRYLWEGVYINRSGQVFACCHQRPKPFGSIYNAPLRVLVNSATAAQLRSDSLRGGLACYPSCNLLDKSTSKPWGDETPSVDYDSLRFLHISFGEACNIRCVMCDNPQRHRDNPILLDPSVVIRNVDLAPFTKIMLRGGEPLYLEECVKFIDHLESIGKRYSLLTNGILIDDAWAGRLARHADSVIVSLNGATKKGHEGVNRGSRFDRVMDNVRRLRLACDESGSTMVLGGHMTITTSNIQEIPLFLRSFRSMGFERVNFGFVKETVPQFLAANPELTAALKGEIAAALQVVAGPNVDVLRLGLLGLLDSETATFGGGRAGVDNRALLPMAGNLGTMPKVPELGGPGVIGDPILSQLRAVGDDSCVIAFVRHSEREKGLARSNTSLEDVPLTARGHELARRFGRELPAFSRVTISHTTIPRSIQTALEIDAGLAGTNLATPSRITGKDSMFSVIYRGTLDKQRRDDYRVSFRGQAFIQLWLDGNLPPSIMRPATMTVARFVQDVKSRLLTMPRGSLHVHVGHDREIELVRTVLFGGRLEDYALMDFLDGLLFVSTAESDVVAQWREKKVTLGDFAVSVPAERAPIPVSGR